ncbi:polysaccharide pyruvyl transferase family protein [Sinomicrobium kalidii]|uniref:polysaccharide pyruvyl transferase family protein n=1 Tax=Sinomicrobium kalidii TaxID=2900738 RepID=UPI001E2E3B76|nr:polysaccharide pyruvyl transferase family protein [Sinomicrobium kalidii]UGU14372.1 polysaccharide pyruvyl transferase family protein [Sinomicrobium kalidii]
MSLLFTGYYGRLNTGDDAFCLISDWAAKKYWNVDDVKFHGRNLPFKKDKTKLNKTLIGKEYFKRQEIIELYYQGLLANKIIYSGGSIFHSDIKGPFNKSNVFFHYHKIKKIKLGAVGVSLGPYKSITARESIREYLKHFSFISLRDKDSYEDAIDMNLSIPIIESFDMAAILPKMYPIIKSKKEKIEIGVSICDYQRFIKKGDIKIDELRFNKMIETIKLLSKRIHNLKINILVFNSHAVNGDYKKSLELQSLISPIVETTITPYSPYTYKMWETVGNCSMILSTRLHAGIFSCFSSTPFLQVEYHKKCSDFLDDIGYDQNFRIGDFNKTPSEVVDIILKIIKVQKVHTVSIDTLQQKALKNFTHTKKYI